MINFHGLEFELKDGAMLLLKTFDSRLTPYPQFYSSYRFAEVQVAGENHDVHGGAKQFMSSEGMRLKYVTHRMEENRLEIVQRSELVEVTSVFEAYEDTNALRIYNRVKNIAKEEICLESVNSFSCYGFGKDGINSANDLYFYKFTNSWHCECQPRVYSFFELGMFNGNNSRSMKRISGFNTGSWSSKEELPQAIIEDRAAEKFFMFEIESNASWYYEIGENFGELYLYLGGPNEQFNQWSKKLSPNEEFESVKVAICHGKTLNETIGEMTKYRRHIVRGWRANETLPSIFNEYMHLAWGEPSETQTAAIAPSVRELGIEYYVIDVAWHDEEDDTYPYVGKWKDSRRRFPSGVKKTVDFIHSLGMKAGLWLEVESLGIKCREMIEYYGKEGIFWRNGKPLAVMNRHFLDFRNPKVRDYIESVFDRLVGEYGVDYIKIDYNQCAGPGTEINSDSLGDGLMGHANAFIDFLNHIMEKYPDLVIENCGSGGMRMDYRMLSVLPIQSTSDQVDYRRYPYIAGNILSAVLPEQAAVWSYPVSDIYNEEGYKKIAEVTSDELVAFNMINALLGRIHLASHVEYLTPEKRELIKQGIEYYNALTPYKKKALPYLPLGFTDFNKDIVASGFRSEKKVFLAVWNLKNAKTVSIPLREIQVKKIKVGYPLSLQTKWEYSDGVLRIEFKDAFSARFFEIEEA